MQFAIFLQRDVSKFVESGLMELEQLLDRISFYRLIWKTKAETVAFPADRAESVKWNTNRPNLKVEQVCGEDFMQIISGARKERKIAESKSEKLNKSRRNEGRLNGQLCSLNRGRKTKYSAEILAEDRWAEGSSLREAKRKLTLKSRVGFSAEIVGETDKRSSAFCGLWVVSGLLVEPEKD